MQSAPCRSLNNNFKQLASRGVPFGGPHRNNQRIFGVAFSVDEALQYMSFIIILRGRIENYSCQHKNLLAETALGKAFAIRFYTYLRVFGFNFAELRRDLFWPGPEEQPH
jgi:hypothetical protein